MNAMATSADESHRVAPRRVLLVDDNDVDRDVLARHLRQRFGDEIEIHEAEDGQGALALVRQWPFDVALVDYLLPDMDGLDVLGEIQRLRHATAVILLTGEGSETVAAAATRRGAKDYCIKRDLTPLALQRAVVDAARTARLEEEKARLVEQLRRAHAELDYLVRALSHDMAANFMVLESSFRQVQRCCEPLAVPRLAEAIAHVAACLGESRHFLEDLVSLGKTGGVDMERAEVDLRRLLEEVRFEQAELLARRGAQLHISPKLPVVWCNPQRMKQLFTNLLRNALKHGCDPSNALVTVEPVERHVCHRGSPMAWIRFADNGPGIPARFREEVFLPGRRVPGTAASGSGMGLAIVKKIVEHYGGSIELDTNSTGAAFLLSLPLPHNEIAGDLNAEPGA